MSCLLGCVTLQLHSSGSRTWYLQGSNGLVYVDDIIVMGKSFEEHLSNLAQVFDQLCSAGIKVKPQKCAFGC